MYDPADGPLVRASGNYYDPDSSSVTDFFDQKIFDDEAFVRIAPFLAVYDDDKAREMRTTDWTDQADYEAELTGTTGYITQFADRIHFNRYTGVVMR